MASSSSFIFMMATVALFLALQPPSTQGASAPCCHCACTRKWPPESNYCFCAGGWEGSCPSACRNCTCNAHNQCACLDGFTIKYCDCMADECSRPCRAAQIKDVLSLI